MHELGTFIITYPCWVLVHKKTLQLDDQGRMKPPIPFMVIDDSSGGSQFPIFTDGDLARRYLKASEEKEEFLIVAVHNPNMLVSALEASRGVTDALTVDMPKLHGKPYAIWPIDYAMQKLAAGEPL